jgi:hypothetical protein
MRRFISARRFSSALPALLASSALLLGAPAWSQNASEASVPEVLRPPADEVLKLKLQGKGVQIYQCLNASWKFQGPEAQLLDAAGHVVGKHYAGPTWESSDGSKVVAEVTAHDDGPDASAIPWLLLHAKANSGQGVFANVQSVQRLQTSGGKAPGQPCGSSNANQIERVPYAANYYFFAAKQ